MAETHRGKVILGVLKAVEVYERYIQALINSERLYKEDLHLLEYELMPIMLREGHYDNQILSSQVEKAKTTDGKPLWELISNTDPMSSGERV